MKNWHIHKNRSGPVGEVHWNMVSKAKIYVRSGSSKLCVSCGQRLNNSALMRIALLNSAVCRNCDSRLGIKALAHAVFVMLVFLLMIFLFVLLGNALGIMGIALAFVILLGVDFLGAFLLPLSRK